MPAATESWYASRATTPYPIDDAATAVDDAGVALPPGIIVDLSVRFPAELGRYLVLSAIAVTPAIVTVLFVAADRPATGPDGVPDATEFRPCAAVSIPQPVDVGRHHAVRGLADGVAGWIVFGDGVLEPYQGRFSTAAQGQVLASLGAPYRRPGVASIAAAGSAAALTGTVTLLAGQDLAVTVGPATIVPAPGMAGAAIVVPAAITIALANTLGRDVFARYAGACQGRPESGTCPAPPLESVSGAVPDCAGTLAVDFPGLAVTALAGGSDALLELARGLAASCPAARLPDPDGTVEPAGGDLCVAGVIPATAIDPAACDGGGVAPAKPATPPPQCPPLYEDFTSLPYTRHGAWGDTLAGVEAALGAWTVGIESTPTTAGYRGGPARLVKVAASAGPAFDVYDTTGLCPDGDARPVDRLFTALVRPHSASGSAGVLFSAAFPYTGFQFVWDVAGGVLALEAVAAAGAPTRISTVSLPPALLVSPPPWAELAVHAQGRDPLGIATGWRAAATLTPVTGPLFPAGTAPPKLTYHYRDPAGVIGHLFGLVAAGGASFGYVFARDRTTTNSLLP